MDPVGNARTTGSTAVPVIALSVLGPLEIRGAAGSSRPGAGRQRRILTVLAVAAMESRTVSAAELLDAVYGDDATDRSRRSLSTELWRCRQLLGGDAIRGEADGYSLDPLVVEVDLVRFTGLVRDGRASLDSGDPARAERGLSQALGLWRDTPLIDWRHHPDGQAALAGLEELRLGATEDLSDALIRQGRYQETLGTLQSFTRLHPAREHAWALLIECHVGLADQRRARSALDSARRTLAEQGLDLGSELGAVRDRLSAPTPSADSTPRGGADAEARPGLIGRRPELEAAGSLLDDALRTARPAAVVVAGEAGIGKTTLLQQLVGDLQRSTPAPGGTFEQVVCDRRLTLPYAALIPLLERLEPEPHELVEMLSVGGTGPDSWIDAAQLRSRVVDLIETATERSGGLVLVVEDAHWATPELIDVLLDLLARRSKVALAMLVSIRDPVVFAPELEQALSELRHRASEVIHLAGLDEAQTRQLLGQELDPETARAAHRLTGGNPLHLRNLIVRATGELVASPTLTEAFDEHLAAFPPDLMPVLEVAAAIGARFDVRVLTSAVAHPPMGLEPRSVIAALQDARAAGLVGVPEPEGHHLAFVHGLVRDRIVDRTAGDARIQAHALIVRALSRISLKDVPPVDLLAHHSEKGWPVCPTDEVIERMRAAGEAAIGQLGFAEAARYFRTALDFVAIDPDLDESAWLPGLLAASGQAAAAAEDLAHARASYLALHSYGERTADPVVALRGALGVVHTYATERIDRAAVDRLASALDRVLDPTPSTTADQERAAVAAALSALHLYRPSAARTLLERASAREPAARPALVSSLWEQETVENALAHAEELAQTPEADPLGSAIRMWASEVAVGQRALTDAPAGIWSLDGSDAARWEARLWQITTAMATGGFARALRLLDAAAREVPGGGTAIGAAGRNAQLLGQRMWIALQRDDWPELERLAVANRPVLTARRPIMRTVGAQMQIVLGDRERAMEYCDDLVDEFLTGNIPSRELHASVVGLGNACLWLGHDRGVELCRELLGPSEGQHVLFYLVQHWGSVRYHLGKYAAHAGDLDEAIEQLRTATAEHHALGASVLEAQSRRLLASSLWHRNGPADRTEADACHVAATRQAESIGMTGVASRAWPPVRAFDHAGTQRQLQPEARA